MGFKINALAIHCCKKDGFQEAGYVFLLKVTAEKYIRVITRLAFSHKNRDNPTSTASTCRELLSTFFSRQKTKLKKKGIHPTSTEFINVDRLRGARCDRRRRHGRCPPILHASGLQSHFWCAMLDGSIIHLSGTGKNCNTCLSCCCSVKVIWNFLISLRMRRLCAL